MPGNSIGQIGLDLVVNQGNFQKQMSGVTGLAKKAGAALAAAFATKQLINFGKECLELGSDLAEVQNVVDVTFPAMTSQVDKFAKSAAASFGLSETMAKQYTGTFGSMAKAFGFTEQQAYDMGTSLTGLAGDVASFYNLSQDEAYTKLKSVFTGETESLKDLGVVMTQAALDSYALANGFGKTTSEMSEAEKVALRYQFVSEQLAAAQGDFARTSDGWANQVRILNLQFDSLKATIGQGLINIFTPVIKMVNTLIGKLSVLANAFKSFTELLTGSKSSGVGNVASDAQAASAGLGDAADSAGDLAENTSAAENAAKKASKALMGFDKINKLDDGTGSGTSAADVPVSSIDYGSLAEGETALDGMNGKLDGMLERFQNLASLFKKGFDLGFKDTDFDGLINELASFGKAAASIFTDPKINAAAKRLVNQTAKTLGVLTGSIARVAVKWGEAVAGGIADSLENNKKWIVNALSGLFNDWRKVLKNVEKIALGISDIFTSPEVLESVQGLSESITTEFLKSAYASLSIGTTIATNLTGGIRKYIEQNGPYIKDKLAGIFNVEAEIHELSGDIQLALADILSVFGGETAQQITADLIGIFADGFLGVTELALKFGRDIISTITEPFIDNKDNIKETIQNFLEPVSTVISTLHDAVKETFERIGKVYDEHVKPMFDSFQEGFSEILGVILEGYNEHIAPVLDYLADKFRKVWEQHVQPCLNSAIDLIGKAADLVSTVWETVLKPVIKWIAEQIMPAIAPVIKWIGDTVLDAIGNISDAIGGVMKALGGVIDFITDVFKGDWESAWEDVKEVFSGVWEAFTGIVRTPMNTILGFVNSFLKGIESMVNGVASALNTISIDLPGWLQDLTGYSSVGFDIPTWTAPQIPYLAQGGFVEKNTPQLAMIGDNRHQGEVVAPEDKLQEMVDAAVGSVRPGITREELEAVVNNAVMRLIAALASVGFNLDGEQVATLQRVAQTGIDRRYNTVNVTV